MNFSSQRMLAAEREPMKNTTISSTDFSDLWRNFVLTPPWMTFTVAGPVLGFYLLSRWLTGHWGSPVVPAAAVLAMLSGPTGSTTGNLHSAPAGLMAVIGSFLLFGLGTLAALTKHRWNRTD